VLEQLSTAKNVYNINLDMKKTFKDDQLEIGSLVSDLILIKNATPKDDLRALAKKIRENYAPLYTKPSFAAPKVFTSAEHRSIYSRFPDLTMADSYAAALSKESFSKVCETIPAETVKKFTELYGIYHELMMLVMIFYYTGCSPAYKSKDITALADDWIRWLKGAPFKVDITQTARQMNAPTFDSIAPQNFFKYLIQDASADAFKLGNAGSIKQEYNEGFFRLISISEEILTACSIATKNLKAGDKLSDYSTRMKFLATVVSNFVEIYEAVSNGAILWRKDALSDKIISAVDDVRVKTCEGGLESIGKQFIVRPGSIGPQFQGVAAAATPGETEAQRIERERLAAEAARLEAERIERERQAALRQPLDDPVFIRLSLLRDFDFDQFQAAPPSDEKNRWHTDGTKAGTYADIRQPISGKLVDVVNAYNYSAPSGDKTMFIFKADESPLDPKVNRDLTAYKLGEPLEKDYFETELSDPNSKYLQPIQDAFDKRDLNSDNKLEFKISAWVSNEDAAADNAP
jgi:hypothetical protein